MKCSLLWLALALPIAGATTLSCTAAPAGKSSKASRKTVVPTNGMKITKDTVFTPGTYTLARGVEIAANGVTLDGNGAVLIGFDHKNSGVLATGRKNVTIKNITARHYYQGIRVQDCENPTVIKNNVTDTAEVHIRDPFLDIWISAEKAYGSGLILIGVNGGRVAENNLGHQQNGICMYSCSGMTVEKNDASYQSGWGILMNNSSDNTIQGNTADFCDRAYTNVPPEYDYLGSDSSGLVMVVNCCRNKILGNNFRAGGDGIFVAGYKGQCNDNLFEGNDCSHSPNNAIECTFCQGNVFRKNRANKSNFGFWLGCSWNYTLTENTAIDNRWAGIAIDHGRDIVISKNRIRANKQGILLWSTNPRMENKEFPALGESESYTITDNVLESNRVGLYSLTTGKGDARCRTYSVTGNIFTDSRVAIIFDRTNDSVIRGNTMSGNLEDIRQTNCAGITAEKNETAAAPANPDARSLPYEVQSTMTD